MECVNLRIQCFNLDSMLLTVHDGKGQKDRTVPLPARALREIREQMDFVRRLHAQDLAAGYAGTFLPRQLEKKYKNAAKEFIWQWFFPASTLTVIPKLGEQRRYHLHESHVQGAVKQAAARAGIPKRVSPHIFRQNAECRKMPSEARRSPKFLRDSCILGLATRHFQRSCKNVKSLSPGR